MSVHRNDVYIDGPNFIFYCSTCGWEIHVASDVVEYVSQGDKTARHSGSLSGLARLFIGGKAEKIEPIPEVFEDFINES